MTPFAAAVDLHDGHRLIRVFEHFARLDPREDPAPTALGVESGGRHPTPDTDKDHA